MSMRYQGGVISATPPTTSTTSATGVWTKEQQFKAQGAGTWPLAPWQVSRSLRFNSADSAYLNRTPGAAGNRRTFTLSFWIKSGSLAAGTTGQIMGTTVGTYDRINFGESSTAQLSFSVDAAGTAKQCFTSGVFRDPSAWYHFVVAVDTTQATDTNRVKIYANGVQQTLTGTFPTQNYQSSINNNVAQYLGSDRGSTYLYSGYMTEVNFIDGQALTPSSFGWSDPATGVWVPIKYTGTYGTNGFYLNFSDNSGTTSTTLGKDYSGNGNNWTPNYFSVTAGVGNDSLVDTPTPYGTDTGAGGEVRGNYATWNPAQPPGSYAATFSDGNLKVTTSSSTAGQTSQVTTIAVPATGNWYAEVTVENKSANNQHLIGIVQDTYNPSSATDNPFTLTSIGYGYNNDGNKRTNSTNTSYGATWTTNNVIGIHLNNGTLTFYKDGVSQGSAYTGLTGNYYFAVAGYGSDIYVLNAGQRPFANTAPSGAKALCTQNLPTPTIGATPTTQAGKYFNPVLWTGNNTARTITGYGFQPDLIWAKSRDVAANHRISDAVRGSGGTYLYNLSSSTTGVENTDTDITGFASDGFTLGGSVNHPNVSPYTYVGWGWKANGAGSSNTSGTITSTVSANTTAGFSIVTYTGTGTAATVGHGLGVSPSLIIVKVRANAGANTAWHVYSSVLGNGSYLSLNTTAGSDTGSIWNNTSPTSTVFSIGSSAWPQVNNNTGTYVAYCFAPIADYSAFGSYSGNNSSTDGPFVYLGFRPRFIMIKSTSAGTDWVMMDSTRSTYNLADTSLYANSTSSESTIGTVNDIDFLSNGFKLRNNTGFVNASQTYIYAAFAEMPFKYAVAR